MKIICTDCGGSYSTAEDALAHQKRLAFVVQFIVVEA